MDDVVIKLPEHTAEDYDYVEYIEDDPEELKKVPKTVADYLWRTINYHLSPDIDTPDTTTQKTQLCYARYALQNKWPMKIDQQNNQGFYRWMPSPAAKIYEKAQSHLFSLDTKRDNRDHFDDVPKEHRQGARFMYGYLAYLVALDEEL